MNNSYHILWIDDEWESMTSFIKNCKLRHNLELHPYKTQKEGLDAFGENQAYWDAIILDAKVLDENEHEVANIGSLYKAVARLRTEFNDIPYFVSTGQPDLTKAEHFESFCKSTYSQRYYEKVVDDEQLCQDIIKAVDEFIAFLDSYEGIEKEADGIYYYVIDSKNITESIESVMTSVEEIASMDPFKDSRTAFISSSRRLG